MPDKKLNLIRCTAYSLPKYKDSIEKTKEQLEAEKEDRRCTKTACYLISFNEESGDLKAHCASHTKKDINGKRRNRLTSEQRDNIISKYPALKYNYVQKRKKPMRPHIRVPPLTKEKEEKVFIAKIIEDSTSAVINNKIIKKKIPFKLFDIMRRTSNKKKTDPFKEVKQKDKKGKKKEYSDTDKKMLDDDSDSDDYDNRVVRNGEFKPGISKAIIVKYGYYKTLDKYEQLLSKFINVSGVSRNIANKDAPYHSRLDYILEYIANKHLDFKMLDDIDNMSPWKQLGLITAWITMETWIGNLMKGDLLKAAYNRGRQDATASSNNTNTTTTTNTNIDNVMKSGEYNDL